MISGSRWQWENHFYLHKKPLFNMLKFGLDATWFDVSYAKYSHRKHQTRLILKKESPIDHLKVSGYFHFIPSGSILVLNYEVNAS